MTDSPTLLAQLQRKLNNVRRDVGWQLGWNRSFVANARGARILAYHGLCKGDPFRFNTLFIRQKTFEKQLQFYKKYFHVISLDDFFYQRFSKERFSICLTFDDGFANNYDYVLPLLQKYELPATFFVTGIQEAGYDILWNDCLSIAKKYGPQKFRWKEKEFFKDSTGQYISTAGGGRLVDLLRSTGFEAKAEIVNLLEAYKTKVEKEYWRQMTEEQIKTLSASKWVTIGSHSYHHNDLAKINPQTLQQDLTRSKHYLENITSKEIKSLAFPYGSYTTQVITEAKAAGFTQLLATDFVSPADGQETCLRERLTINPFISTINQIHANITGHYN